MLKIESRRAVSAAGRWFGRRWPGLLTLAAVGLFLFWMYSTSGRVVSAQDSYSPDKAAAFMQSLKLSSSAPATEIRREGGRAWNKIAEQANLTLWFDPQTGQISVSDSKTGAFWNGNPTPEALKEEQSKGVIRSNLESPFLFSYLDEGKTTPGFSNTVDQKAAVEWQALEGGIGVRYTMEEKGLAVYIEYKLEDGTLAVRIPELGVAETGKSRLVTLDLLPFFGAAPAGSDGYLLVPDGPGALIGFGDKHLEKLTPYLFPVYGDDPSVPFARPDYARKPISFPVFGLKNGNAGWLAVLEEGAVNSYVKAAPAGMSTSFHQANAVYDMRRYYWQPTGLHGWKSVYETDLAMEAKSIRYLFAEPGKSDYVGLAKLYRNYLTGRQGVQPQKPDPGAPPLLLDFVVGTSEKTPFGQQEITATTFDQAGAIAMKLKSEGVDRMKVGLTGWQNGGMPGYLPDRFPVGKAAGGEKGLRSLIDTLHGQDIKVSIQDLLHMAIARDGTGFSPSKQGMKNIYGTTVKFDNVTDFGFNPIEYYLVDPKTMQDGYLPDLLDKAKSWGADDVGLLGLAEIIYSNFHPSNYTSRTESAEINREILTAAKQAVGGVSSSGAFAYLLGAVDHMGAFPSNYNYDLLVDEQVPFYPIAVHGLVTYDSGYGNMRSDPVVEFLRDLEYGALPAYEITHEDPRVLKRTFFAYLYSSQFEVLEDRILQEYDAYKQALTGVWNRFIEDHRKLADGVYETVYEGGKRVVVNYNQEPYGSGRYQVGALSYQILEGDDSR